MVSINNNPREVIGIIAGGGKLPEVLASAIKNRGEFFLIGLGIKGEAESSLKKYTDEFHCFNLTELDHLKEIIKKEKIKKIIMAGKVHKDILLKDIKLDDKSANTISFLANKGDYHILKAFASDFEKEGVHFLDPTFFLGNLIPIVGTLTKRHPHRDESEDINFGLPIARKIAELDIGQAIVVKNRIVLAVEGIEGTDETIKRGGALGKNSGVVIKVTKPHQDLRFDMPVIGESTVDVARRSGITCIAVESHKIIVIDREEVVKEADKHGISIIAV
jgi:DUF1009 family protein